jgi:hypothetical protein
MRIRRIGVASRREDGIPFRWDGEFEPPGELARRGDESEEDDERLTGERSPPRI